MVKVVSGSAQDIPLPNVEVNGTGEVVWRSESSIGSKDLHVIYRPYKLEHMLGNESNKRIVKKGLDNGTLPHTMLFIGPAGCGKTTMARIIATGLNCEHGPTSKPCLKCSQCRSIINYSSLDVMEINVGKTGGKDDVAKIVADLPSSPFSAKYKVLIFDEAHKLTDAAKDLLLKPIEDGYNHVYYIFCTNHPEKLRTRKNKKDGEAFLDRCHLMEFKAIAKEEIVQLLNGICGWEGQVPNKDVINLIAEESLGIPRRAITWLRQIIDDGTWNIEVVKPIIGILSEEDDPQIIEICRALQRGNFEKAVSEYDKLSKKMGADAIRIPILFYFLSCLKGASDFNKRHKFSRVMDILTPFVPESGKLGNLVMIHNFHKIAAIMSGRIR